MWNIQILGCVPETKDIASISVMSCEHVDVVLDPLIALTRAMDPRRSSILPTSGPNPKSGIREVLSQDSTALTAGNDENLGSEWPTVGTSETAQPSNDDRSDLG